MPRPPRRFRTIGEWMDEAEGRPVIAELVSVGSELREASIQRQKAREEAKPFIARYDAQVRLFDTKARAAEHAVLRAVEEGLSTPDIAEILGVSTSWVTRVRANGARKPGARIATTGPKLVRGPDGGSDGDAA